MPTIYLFLEWLKSMAQQQCLHMSDLAACTLWQLVLLSRHVSFSEPYTQLHLTCTKPAATTGLLDACKWLCCKYLHFYARYIWLLYTV